MSIKGYINVPLDVGEMALIKRATFLGYGTGESHRGIIERAGGELGYDGFQDPRPGRSGDMIADKVFINQENNQIQGINFSRGGAFCCSYVGENYDDIKGQNWDDCMHKPKPEETESKTLARQRSGELASGAGAFETESKTLARQRRGELAPGRDSSETESKTLAWQRATMPVGTGEGEGYGMSNSIRRTPKH